MASSCGRVFMLSISAATVICHCVDITFRTRTLKKIFNSEQNFKMETVNGYYFSYSDTQKDF